MLNAAGNPGLEFGPHAGTESPSHEAKFLNARMGWGELFDCHVDNRSASLRLLLCRTNTPSVEFAIPFEQQLILGIIGNLPEKIRMLPHIAVELKSQ